jgi:hypothetical protein
LRLRLKHRPFARGRRSCGSRPVLLRRLTKHQHGLACKYCQVMVAGDAFDWSLSKIEQDEVYKG